MLEKGRVPLAVGGVFPAVIQPRAAELPADVFTTKIGDSLVAVRVPEGTRYDDPKLTHAEQFPAGGVTMVEIAALPAADAAALFLDIKMPGEDGFALLRSLQGQKLPVVFTTAYDEYALQAFRENALDYLEKPIDVEELKRASSKLRRMTSDPTAAPQQTGAIAALLLDPASPLSKRMAVPGRDGLTLLKHEDILYLEASDSYTTIHTRDGKRQISSKHIRVFENNLDPKRFFRVHKSYIINLEHLRAFSRGEGNMAVLDNGAMIPVSRRKMPDFLALIPTF